MGKRLSRCKKSLRHLEDIIHFCVLYRKWGTRLQDVRRYWDTWKIWVKLESPKDMSKSCGDAIHWDISKIWVKSESLWRYEWILSHNENKKYDLSHPEDRSTQWVLLKTLVNSEYMSTIYFIFKIWISMESLSRYGHTLKSTRRSE